MGHRFSKTAANNIAAAKTSTWKTTNNINNNNNNTSEQLQAFHTTTNIIPIPNGRQQQQQQQTAQFVGPTINLQIQESPNITDTTGAHCIGATTSINSLTTTAAANSSILQIPQQQQQQQYNTNSISSSSLTSVNNLSCGGRQIIIKIQLAKMENGNETATTATTTMSAAASSPSVQYLKDTSLENLTADCNLNSTESSSSSSSTMVTSTTTGSHILNLTLNSGNSSCNSNSITATATTTARTIPHTSSSSASSSSASTSTSTIYRTAGSSLNKNNNNNYFNTNSMGNNNNNSISSCIVMPTTSRFERPERLNSSLQFNDDIVEQNIGEIVEYCEVLEQQQPPTTSSCNNTQMLTIKEETDNNEPNACCRRKSKSLAANAGNGSSTAGSSTNSSSNTGTKAKSRCRKCSCRDAFRRFLDPSLSRSPSSNKAAKQQQQKEQKRNKSQDRHSTNNNNNNNNNTTTISNSLMNNNSMHSNNTNISARPTTATTAIVMPSVATNQVSLWTSATATPHGNDVIIPLTAPTPPQFVVVQCAIVNASNSLPPTPNTIMSASSTSSSNIPTNGLISIAHDISPTTSSSSTTNNEFKLCPNNNTLTGSQTTVHSQVDYVHYLVPDLERITNSSFYWGKMDRYEAERLLEGKPEGTFLLRDSAQEEFLFSVTFRKYGRSLHARIEQSGHRFSFDCHDPCVFTAPTVTGLLEHYKDPACVMFFEPMLTIPLHRKNCFSLQKLCRATIVSNTTYDGINELELPARLKAYLKEYHYKQKLRVKFNEPSYTIHCK